MFVKTQLTCYKKTRYAKYFEIIGDTKTHFGACTSCATLASQEENQTEQMSSSCGCQFSQHPILISSRNLSE